MGETIREFKASRKQMAFLQSTKKHTCYGGARGGGKSWVVDLDACIKARQYPGIREVIVRRTLEDVRKNHIIPLRKMLMGIAKFKQQDRCFVFPNGSVIEFQYYDSEKDIDHFQGIEWQIIYIEEATQMEEQWLKNIATSCRGGPAEFPRRVLYTCNPGGPGHTYIKRLFVDRIYEDTERAEDYEFIQAKVTDNLYLMRTQPEYLDFLRALPPKLRAAWLDGEWDVFEGQFFEDFRVEPDVRTAIRAGCNMTKEELMAAGKWTHVIKPFMPKKNWQIYRSFDWGYHRPFSCGWWAVDEEGTIYRIAEYYGVQYSNGRVVENEGLKMTPDQVFAEIQRIEKEHPFLIGRKIHGVADPAIWDAERGDSIADVAEKYGVYFDPGDHARIPGWMQCHYRLQFDENGFPRMYVFDTCKEFIRTIPTLQYDKNKAEDLDSKQEDHAADEWRYMAMQFIIKAQPIHEEKYPMYGADPLNQMIYSRR